MNATPSLDCSSPGAALRAKPVRWLVALVAAFAALFVARFVGAEAVAVPAEVQAQLLSRLAAYDRNFAARAGDTAVVLIVVKPGNSGSAFSAAAFKQALSRVDRIGGLPHQVRTVTFEGATALTKECRLNRAAVVYVTPGFDDNLKALRTSFAGLDLLTVSAVPEYVLEGVVLGFELVSGKPKILLNFAAAKQQHVDFKAESLKLMKVYR